MKPMDEAAAKKWVKDKKNQAAVLAKFFKDFPHTDSKIAFFMAGIPGAGKTEFTEQVLRDSLPLLIPIEHDKLVEYIDGYQPENYYNYRKAGSTLVTEVFNACIKHNYSFIFDGTLISREWYPECTKSPQSWLHRICRLYHSRGQSSMGTHSGTRSSQETRYRKTRLSRNM